MARTHVRDAQHPRSPGRRTSHEEPAADTFTPGAARLRGSDQCTSLHNPGAQRPEKERERYLPPPTPLLRSTPFPSPLWVNAMLPCNHRDTLFPHRMEGNQR